MTGSRRPGDGRVVFGNEKALIVIVQSLDIHTAERIDQCLARDGIPTHADRGGHGFIRRAVVGVAGHVLIVRQGQAAVPLREGIDVAPAHGQRIDFPRDAVIERRDETAHAISEPGAPDPFDRIRSGVAQAVRVKVRLHAKLDALEAIPRHQVDYAGHGVGSVDGAAAVEQHIGPGHGDGRQHGIDIRGVPTAAVRRGVVDHTRAIEQRERVFLSQAPQAHPGGAVAGARLTAGIAFIDSQRNHVIGRDVVSEKFGNGHRGIVEEILVGDLHQRRSGLPLAEDTGTGDDDLFQRRLFGRAVPLCLPVFRFLRERNAKRERGARHDKSCMNHLH